MRRALAVVIAAGVAVTAGAAAAVVAFVLEVWHIGRGIDVSPVPTPHDDPDLEMDGVTEDEIDRLAYSTVGMPTVRWGGTSTPPRTRSPTACSTRRDPE